MSAPVYVDFDDVLCETARALAALIEREFGKSTAFEDIHSFDLALSFGLDENEAERLFAMFHDAEVLSGIPPVEGAADGIRAWHAAGAQIHVVTGRPPSTHDASAAWLSRHGVPHKQLTFVDKYGRNHPHIEGVDIMSLDELRTRAFCMAIDDSPTAIQFLAEHTEVPILIFDRPWNVSLDTPGESSRIIRCKTWSDVLERVPDPTQWGGTCK
ncbi:MAG: hypothetical protein HN341_17275 [Verrucomicrobia bacterium]|jgi:uncharacterized protein|nr:hypothetical protein [Verrucomicrobiota bacterium]